MERHVRSLPMQIAIDCETQFGVDSVYFTIEGDHVTVNHEDSNGDEGSFILHNEEVQQVFDFLKDKGVVT